MWNSLDAWLYYFFLGVLYSEFARVFGILYSVRSEHLILLDCWYFKIYVLYDFFTSFFFSLQVKFESYNIFCFFFKLLLVAILTNSYSKSQCIICLLWCNQLYSITQMIAEVNQKDTNALLLFAILIHLSVLLVVVWLYISFTLCWLCLNIVVKVQPLVEHEQKIGCRGTEQLN